MAPAPSISKPPEQPHPDPLGLLIVCCLPVAVIAAVLLGAGGTSPGFLIPALTCGVVLGMLVFMAFWDRPAR